MKICLLAPANSVHTLKIAYSLKESGNEVLIISFHKALPEDIDALYFPPSVSPLGKLNYLLHVSNIKKIVEQYRPDILHAHYISSYGLVGSLLNYQPFIVSVWGSDIFDFPNKSILHKYLIIYALNKADFILSTSNIMAKETKKYTDKEVFVTPFGVDCEKFKPMPELKPKDKIIIGTIKALKSKYGIEYLIRAFKILVDKYPNLPLKLHIGGEGYLKEELEKSAKSLNIGDRVKFLGFIPHDEVPKYFNMFTVSVSVSVSESESFGVAVVEAEACGVPVVVSNIGGLPEVVKDGETGFIVPPKNSEATANAIEKILLDEELRRKLSVNARNFVLDKYNWKDNFKLIAEIYKEAIEEMDNV
jgi:glycosyltransferase involved in cell wall biosynthesis